ncbi:hypothetical protein ACCO45_004917 [Purpureocillium lilacinum]|uniref:Uncharacterized protein n=1 Tax=Purpureocillium lilacinum TaxID=33203 RepID=A0ACC4DTX8_PURLI
MNHPTAQFLTALLAITPLADAFTCRPGRAYCGYHLMAGGITEGQLSSVLKRNVLSANDLSKRENDVRQMLFVCEDGGAFRFKQRPPPTNKPHTADAPRPAPHRTAPQPIMPADSDKRAAAQQAVDILHEISTILNCHLDRRTLSICISMIERGVNPEAMAQVIKELRQEAQRVE